jgi:hypothetical protein
MADRTIRIYGKVWGDPSNPATISVNWNGQIVYNGAVDTAAGSPDSMITWDSMTMLSSWTISTDVVGQVPFSIAVTNGSLVLNCFHGNYAGNVYNSEIPPVLVIPSIDNFQSLSGAATTESDGKNNVQIDGIPAVRNPTDAQEATGAWNYLISPGATLTCDAVVIAAKDV